MLPIWTSSRVMKLKPWNGVGRTRDTVPSSTLGHPATVAVVRLPALGFPEEMPHGPNLDRAAMASALTQVVKQPASVAKPAWVGVNDPVEKTVPVESIS